MHKEGMIAKMSLKSKLNELNYSLWIKNNEPSKKELEEQKKYKFDYEPKISIIVPMYNTKEQYLQELINSLIKQTYKNWELCLTDGSNKVYDYVEKLIKQDERIKYKFLNENKGISENSNEALKLATGEYIALLDHDDILPAFALYEVVKIINKNREVELIYSDEDKILDENKKRVDPHFKQDYAPETLLSYNYICHFLVLKNELMEKLGGFRKEFDGSQDYDLILRATEIANKIVHIPKILYHWRINENSVALNSEAKTYAYDAGKKAIEEHLKRIKVDAMVEELQDKGTYKINYKLKGTPKASIVIINKDNMQNLEKCINAILKNTSYNNYEIIIVDNNSKENETLEYYREIKQNEKVKILQPNKLEQLNKTKQVNEAGQLNNSQLINLGVKNAAGDYIVLLNRNIQVNIPNWLEIMISNCQSENIGIVGAKIIDENSKVFHEGIVIGMKRKCRLYKPRTR